MTNQDALNHDRIGMSAILADRGHPLLVQPAPCGLNLFGGKMPDITSVQNTNQIPTQHGENYALVNIDDQTFLQDEIDILQDAGKQIGHIYLLGTVCYYIEVVQ